MTTPNSAVASERRTSLVSRADETTLDRYRTLYHLGSDVGLDQVRFHLVLEGHLTERLLSASRDERRRVFADCYGELYEKLPWLSTNSAATDVDPGRAIRDFRLWDWLLGRNSRVYEIGSGAGAMARYLAQQGHRVTATEVTEHRGDRAPVDRLTWVLTDGVHLDRFEPRGTYDHVVSDQVFEHLHPDDHLEHFRTALAILRPGGSYILRTPHLSAGPADVTCIFPEERSPLFMHLCEPTFRYLEDRMLEAGFRRVEAVGVNPFTRRTAPVFASSLFLKWQILVETIEATAFSDQALRRRFRRTFARYLRIRSSAWVVGRT